MNVTRGKRPWLSSWEIVPAILVALVAFRVGKHAFTISESMDFGLAYRGGTVAWRTGRPEFLDTWISTPFLGMMMAICSRIVTEATGARLWTWFNLGLYYGTLLGLWIHFRRQVGRIAWWTSLFVVALFAPAVSTIWWKQFNLVALAFAAAGFALLRLKKFCLAGLLSALSLLIKPVALLLPIALLARRESRRAGLATVAWSFCLLALSQGFLAWRAGSFGTLLPLDALRKFSEKSRPEAFWACHPENFSPQSMLCRLAGTKYWSLQRGFVLVGVALLCLLAVQRLRDHDGDSWEIFAFACVLSPMVSPIAWSHYQLLCLPLILVAAWRFYRERPALIAWLLLVFSYVLMELVWQPSGTLIGAMASALGGHQAEDFQSMSSVFLIAMFAQYFIFLVGVVFLPARRPERSGEASVAPKAARGDC